ncbi:D-glycerate dehydrogenase [Sphingomonas metalli]|uniref:D-glycerate dehydrogenase n=1 Tax=Sphingomonas metalli TaxID=1779358 RepID=A0A916WR81_9SPHN|nr:D-glycerate dehydrogenase [Sphingomonas metalli]GGB26877.1 D-glycerate dehydrogenase [Sphingomonas metalli]
MSVAADRPRLFVTRRLPDAVERRLAADYAATFNAVDRPLGRDELARALREHDALLVTITDRIDAALLAGPDRRAAILVNYGAGTDHIDLAAAAAAGLPVTNTPDALTDSTAELALLLMLMAARRAGEGERELRARAWTGWRPTHLIGMGLAGRTLGLVGFGRIAQSLAGKARALGMEIAYFSRSPAAPAVEAALAARRCATLPELLARADIVSLHVPGGAATRHLIDRAALGRMRPHAILVNTARGPVVDEAALAAALAEGRLGAAALDVYEREPEVHPDLLAQPRTVLLPHLGSATLETRTAMGMQAADNLDAFFAGRPLPHRVA